LELFPLVCALGIKRYFILPKECGIEILLSNSILSGPLLTFPTRFMKSTLFEQPIYFIFADDIGKKRFHI